MNTSRKQYIDDHQSLFWYTPDAKKGNISDALLLETILNYGTMNDVKGLFDIMDIDHAADVFFAAKGREKQNYYPEIRNFFTLVFKKYAHRNT